MRTLGLASDVAWRLLVCAAALAVLVYALWTVRVVALPVFVAILVSTVLIPPAQWLRRRGLPPVAATGVVFLGAAAVAAGIAALIVPPLVDEFGALGDQVSGGADELGSIVASGPFGLSEADAQDAVDQARDRLESSSDTLASGAVSGALLVGELIAGLLLCVVLVFFFVKDGDRMWAWLLERTPSAHHDLVDRVGRRCYAVLSAYVRGIAVVAVVDAVLIGIALALIGVPLVIPLAALTFVGAFFPLIGAFVAGLAAALVALVAQGALAAILVVIAITVIQQLEGDLLYPVVVGRTLALHPVVILLAVAIGAVLGGIIGAFVAVPVAAVTVAITSTLRSTDSRERHP